MSIRTNIAAVAAVALLGVSGAFAGPFSLFASFGYNHGKAAPTGGLRYSLSSDICFDGAAGAALGYGDSSGVDNGFSVYGDAFFFGQTVGVGVTLTKYGDADLVPALMLMYALEKPINDKITLGISPTLLSYTIAKGNGIDILSGVNIYAIVGF